MTRKIKKGESQSERFIKAARGLGADEDDAAFMEKPTKIAKVKSMAVFRLDPIDHASPRWEASTAKETIFIKASDPWEARQRAQMLTLRAVHVRPGSPVLHSPWLDDKLTMCVLEPSRDDVPDGAVINVQGGDVSNRH